MIPEIRLDPIQIDNPKTNHSILPQQSTKHVLQNVTSFSVNKLFSYKLLHLMHKIYWIYDS